MKIGPILALSASLALGGCIPFLAALGTIPPAGWAAITAGAGTATAVANFDSTVLVDIEKTDPAKSPGEAQGAPTSPVPATGQ